MLYPAELRGHTATIYPKYQWRVKTLLRCMARIYGNLWRNGAPPNMLHQIRYLTELKRGLTETSELKFLALLQNF